MEKTDKKKPGPLPGPETTKITVLIEPHLIDWGKQKPGGLSRLIRQLLQDAYATETQR